MGQQANTGASQGVGAGMGLAPKAATGDRTFIEKLDPRNWITDIKRTLGVEEDPYSVKNQLQRAVAQGDVDKAKALAQQFQPRTEEDLRLYDQTRRIVNQTDLNKFNSSRDNVRKELDEEQAKQEKIRNDRLQATTDAQMKVQGQTLQAQKDIANIQANTQMGIANLQDATQRVGLENAFQNSQAALMANAYSTTMQGGDALVAEAIRKYSF